MIDRRALLADLQKLLVKLEKDLLERSESSEVPAVGARLRSEYEHAKKAERTAQNYEDWRTDAITQHAAAWALSGVFVRFLEDNRLIEPPRLAGPAQPAGSGSPLQRARDEHELYFSKHPRETDREYLLSVFDELTKLPGTRDVFGEHNPIRELPNWLSGDAAGELLKFFQKIDPNTGDLVHDFTDPHWDTRFLGDLYQDLSEAARKKYALLQTPEFVEEFILDRTLDPALEEFGLNAPAVLDRDGRPRTATGFRMIDPACGSGHFLLGAFPRILKLCEAEDRRALPADRVQKALNAIYGVDLNPYAVAIARFRLLLAAMQASQHHKLLGAPAYTLHIACGDSLLHSPLRDGQKADQHTLDFENAADDEECEHAYQSENLPVLKSILRNGLYHAVVANPPYITPKDRKLNERYRKRFTACHMKYSLSVPFMERIFRLAVKGGFTGQITSNSFMKREFGKKLIEQFLPTVDLTHVIDASGAYIPGHGTPTTILFGQQRSPLKGVIRTVMGIRGEPRTPDNPAKGLVWSAIVEQFAQVGSQSEYVSVADSSRDLFTKHPWSIGGGGASELKEQMESKGTGFLNDSVESIGFLAITGEDDIFVVPQSFARRCRLPFRKFCTGDTVRDWRIESSEVAIFPYDESTDDLRTLQPVTLAKVSAILWAWRIVLASRNMFGKTVVEHGFHWLEYIQFIRTRAAATKLIAFAEVATHNHFVLDSGRTVFKQTAPVIKLPPDASSDDHLILLGLLNSSSACFWLKQVCHQKQMMGGDGVRIESKAKVPYAFNATQMGRFPMPAESMRSELLNCSRRLVRLSEEYASLTPRTLIEGDGLTAEAIRSRWISLKRRRSDLRSQQLLAQEDLDFIVYKIFGFVDDALLVSAEEAANTVVTEGERPFCIFARENEDGFPVPNAVPRHWPEPLQRLWEQRLQAIRTNSDLRLIECSSYKRRWIGRQGLFNHKRADDELADAAREWLLDRLESYFDFDGRMNDAGRPTAQVDLGLISVARLADLAASDELFHQVGAVLQDDPAFDVPRLVAALVESESVPLLPVLRYKPSGLRKREEWEQTWALQRREDAGETVGRITVPPKYTSADFLKSDFWRLRGKLDVPKERWISFPHCEGPDGSLMICWAGYNHLQQAQSISAYFIDVQERLGGRDDLRLVPLLAALLDLLPWLKQWHNEPQAEFNGERMGDYFETFLSEEARQLNKTLPEIKAWTPPAKVGRGRKK